MLTVEERLKLRKFLVAMYDFATARGRLLMLEGADMGRFVPGLQLDADPQQFATELIVKLEKHGELGPPSTFKALGALLGYLVLMEDTPLDHRQFYAELIVKYSLSSDPDYLDRLKKQFGVAVAPLSPAPQDVPLLYPAAKFPEVSPALSFSADDESNLESIIHGEDNFLDMHTLATALQCATAVCRVEIPTGQPMGTGFLVGPDLLLTNHHVISSQDQLEGVALRFGFQSDPQGAVTTGTTFSVQKDFYKTSKPEELDYALVRVSSKPLEGTAGRQYLGLSGRTLVRNERVAIIQHPAGLPKKVVLTQNYVAQVLKTRVQYVADTMEGSSGSPVFDAAWNVVALHHSGAPYPPDGAGEKVKRLVGGKWRVNEGIPMRPILDEIQRYLT